MATGEVIVFDETTPINKRHLAIISSGSIPVFFPPVDDLMPNKVLTDGGVFANLEIDDAIIKCREKGFDDENIILDVIVCFD